LYKTGATKEGDQLLEEIYQQTLNDLKTGNVEFHYDLACIYSIQGKNSQAIEALERMGYYPVSYIEKDPIFENVRNDPKFQKLMQKMKTKSAEIRSRISTM
jgi:hypothetical protein